MKRIKLNYVIALNILYLLSISLSIVLAQNRQDYDYQRSKSLLKMSDSYNKNRWLKSTSSVSPMNSVDPDTNTSYWKSRGYGYLACKKEDTILLYGHTRVSIVLEDTLILINNQLYYHGIPVADYFFNDSLFIISMGKEIIFDVIDTLPCIAYSGRSDNPVVNFEVLWNTFNENCSLFEVTHTDWDSIYTLYKPMISDTTDNETLFAIFSEMLAPLKDGHSFIYDEPGEQFYTPGPTFDNFWIEQPEMMLGNIQQRLDDQELFITANDMVLYGTINNHKIGYFNILGMTGYSNNENFEPNEEIIAGVLDNLVDEFVDCKAIIVDVRLNNGGEDLVSFEIASRFNDQVRVGYSRQYRYGGYDEYSELVQTYTQFDEKNFGNKPVILLTSNHTLSAADVFAMIMKDIPTVTLLGEHTYGIFSDVLGKKLPNGWEFSLSNERYFSSEGINYEQIGIYPDIELALDSVGFFNGTDNILEKAVELVSQSDLEKVSFESLSLHVFPNPGANKVTIEVALPDGQYGELRIIDMAGNVVTIYNVHGTETINWNSEGYSEGLYLAVLNNGFSSESIKISKLK